MYLHVFSAVWRRKTRCRPCAVSHKPGRVGRYLARGPKPGEREPHGEMSTEAVGWGGDGERES
jgi:hypothetical protein